MPDSFQASIPAIEGSRAARRREANMSEGEKRRRMRGVFKAILFLAKETNDSFIMKRLEYWMPWVRVNKPVSEGISKACQKLDKYADELELEVKLAVLDESKKLAAAEAQPRMDSRVLITQLENESMPAEAAAFLEGV